MSTIQITNKRNVYSVEAQGANVKLIGNASIDNDKKIADINGDIRIADEQGNDIYIGNFSLFSVNIHNENYISYRTEASQVVDELTAYLTDYIATADEQA